MLSEVARGIFLVHIERSLVTRTGGSSNRFADIFLANHDNQFAQKAYTSFYKKRQLYPFVALNPAMSRGSSLAARPRRWFTG